MATKTKWGPTHLIARDQIVESIGMSDALEIVEAVLKAHGEGKVLMPAKVTMDLKLAGVDGWNTAMPAHIDSLGASGLSWVGGYFQNIKVYGLPFIMRTILLQDPANGYPVAIMDGVHILNLRTAAVVGVCAKYYANPKARSLAIIGAGVVGRFALRALNYVLPLDDVRVYDKRPEAVVEYIDEMKQELGIATKGCASAEEAVRGAEVVITATTTTSPIIRRDWLGRGVTVVVLGGQGQELETPAILEADKLICDSYEQCTHLGALKTLSEEGLVTRDNVFAEIGDTIAGIRPGREDPDEYIVVVPIGLGSLDVAIAKVAHDRVLAAGGKVATFRFFN